MVGQYPYTLKVLKKTESVYDEETGNFIPGSEKWICVSQCRDEGNGGGGKIVTSDSESYVYGAVIYVPKSCPNIDLGAKIKVVDIDGNVRLLGDNKLFKKEQMHARLWL